MDDNDKSCQVLLIATNDETQSDSDLNEHDLDEQDLDEQDFKPTIKKIGVFALIGTFSYITLRALGVLDYSFKAYK